MPCTILYSIETGWLTPFNLTVGNSNWTNKWNVNKHEWKKYRNFAIFDCITVNKSIFWQNCLTVQINLTWQSSQEISSGALSEELLETRYNELEIYQG